MRSALTSLPGTVFIQSFFIKKTWYVNDGGAPSIRKTGDVCHIHIMIIKKKLFKENIKIYNINDNTFFFSYDFIH